MTTEKHGCSVRERQGLLHSGTVCNNYWTAKTLADEEAAIDPVLSWKAHDAADGRLRRPDYSKERTKIEYYNK